MACPKASVSIPCLWQKASQELQVTQAAGSKAGGPLARRVAAKRAGGADRGTTGARPAGRREGDMTEQTIGDRLALRFGQVIHGPAQQSASFRQALGAEGFHLCSVLQARHPPCRATIRACPEAGEHFAPGQGRRCVFEHLGIERERDPVVRNDIRQPGVSRPHGGDDFAVSARAARGQVQGQPLGKYQGQQRHRLGMGERAEAGNAGVRFRRRVLAATEHRRRMGRQFRQRALWIEFGGTERGRRARRLAQEAFGAGVLAEGQARRAPGDRARGAGVDAQTAFVPVATVPHAARMVHGDRRRGSQSLEHPNARCCDHGVPQAAPASSRVSARRTASTMSASRR